MVMVDGVLYADTGRLSQAEGRCGVMDGYLTSSVASGAPTRTISPTSAPAMATSWALRRAPSRVYIGQEWVVFAPAGKRNLGLLQDLQQPQVYHFVILSAKRLSS